MKEEYANIIKDGYITVPIYEKSFGTEISTDITLPDYQNEIRRILHVEQTVLPPSKYVSPDGVEFNGTIDYRMLYIGDGGELCGASMSGEYSFSIPIEKSSYLSLDNGVSVLCGICAESVSTRVSAPRRLSVKSRIRPNVRIYGQMKIDGAQLLGDLSGGVYKQTESALCSVCEEASSDVISIEQSLSAIDEDARIVAADAKVHVTSCEVGTSGVTCRGKLITKLLISSADGEISTKESSAPFECDVDMENIQGARVRAHGNAVELTVSVTDTGVLSQAGVIVTATSYVDKTTAYVSDMYSDTYECKCEMAEQSIRRVAACVNSNISIGERFELTAKNIPENARVIDAFGNAVIDRCTRSDDGKYVFLGNAHVCVLWNDGGEMGSSEVDMPVRYEMQGASEDPTCFDATSKLVDIRARIDGNELCVDAELIISADCMCENTLSYVRGAGIGERIDHSSNELVVCYPDPSDTLWSIAKRYAVSPVKIIGDVDNDKYVLIE